MKSYNVKSNAKRFARGIAAKWPGQLEAAEPVADGTGREWFPAVKLVVKWTEEAMLVLRAFAGATTIIIEPEPEANEDEVLAAEGLRPEPEPCLCFICKEPIKVGDRVLSDISEGIGHRACFGNDRAGFVKDLETAEPLGENDPLPEGDVWTEQDALDVQPFAEPQRAHGDAAFRDPNDWEDEDGGQPVDVTGLVCPGCGVVAADNRQPERNHLCRWCGWNYQTNQPAGFVSASDPFAALDAELKADFETAFGVDVTGLVGTPVAATSAQDLAFGVPADIGERSAKLFGGGLMMVPNGKGGETPAIKSTPTRPAPGKDEPSRPAPELQTREIMLAGLTAPRVKRTPEEIAQSRAERRARIEAGQYAPITVAKEKAETKGEIILRMAGQENGATAEAIASACGWQAHTLRGYIGGTLRKRLVALGKTIEAVRNKGEPTRYVVADLAKPAE